MTANNNFILIFLLIFSFFACSKSQIHLNPNLPPTGEFFNALSEYNLFDVRNGQLIPHEKLVKYEVTNALFTDYAEKDRFILIPDDQKATLSEDGDFSYPIGSLIVKNFYFTADQVGSENLVETRLLIKDEAEWKAISYVWDENKSDATISKIGATIPMSINHNTRGKLDFDYIVPNKNQCKSCHNKNEKIDPLGFVYANLNGNVESEGGIVNQLAYLNGKGIIDLTEVNKDSLSSMVSYLDQSANIQDRALGYLDSNCGHCHRPDGPGNTSGLFLQFDEERLNHLGFCKAPVAAGRGSGGRKFDIYPGSADSSIIIHRMSSIDPGVMMPELGRSLVHEEGVTIIREWINNINYDCYAK